MNKSLKKLFQRKTICMEALRGFTVFWTWKWVRISTMTPLPKPRCRWTGCWHYRDIFIASLSLSMLYSGYVDGTHADCWKPWWKHTGQWNRHVPVFQKGKVASFVVRVKQCPWSKPHKYKISAGENNLGNEKRNLQQPWSIQTEGAIPLQLVFKLLKRSIMCILLYTPCLFDYFCGCRAVTPWSGTGRKRQT